MMKILLSPTKTMTPSKVPPKSLPHFLHEAKIVKAALDITLKKTSLVDFYKCSEKTAERISKMWEHFSWEGGSPAMYTFTGLVFTHLHPESLDKGSILYLEKNLYIFSGLYGILSAFDAIMPYRLDYENTMYLASQSLKSYWSKKIHTYLKGEKLILNLASKEYAEPLLSYEDLPLVSVDFKTYKNGKFISLATHSKIARGELARLLAISEASTLDDVVSLCPAGFYYHSELSTQKNLVFIKG